MLGVDLYIISLIVVISLFVAVFASWLIIGALDANKKSTHMLMIEGDSETVFLFENETLIDATDSARKLLGPTLKGATDQERLILAFGSRFSTLADDLLALGAEGTLTIVPDSPNDTARIKAEWWNGFSRLVFVETEDAVSSPLVQNTNITALESELETLRRTAKLAPYLVWQETVDGKINWVNSAYLALANSINTNGKINSWPPTRLFDLPKSATEGPKPKTLRVSLNSSEPNELLWFDLSCKKVNASLLCFAIPADAAVQAETSQKDFVQTLTKTFADLSIGLAVFDKTRKLVLFNPALTDMIRLPIDFLSMRPTLFSFLDNLREKQMMPEPKNYKNWRDRMAALERAAADGTYEETWNLPGGQTYRVIGRPHPDGAVALMFEDISAEISLTRGFRQELEISQSVLDTLDDAVVVFSSSGSILMSNSAYAALWGVDPSSSFGEIGVVDATRSWQEICDPTPLWGQLQDFISKRGERTEWFGDAFLDDGHPLACRFSPLASGTTLVQFRILQADKSSTSREKSNQLR